MRHLVVVTLGLALTCILAQDASSSETEEVSMFLGVPTAFWPICAGLLFCICYLIKLNTLTLKEFFLCQIPLHIAVVPPMIVYVFLQRLCLPALDPNSPEYLGPSVDNGWGRPENLTPNPEGWPEYLPAAPQVHQFLAYLGTYLSFTIPMVYFYKPYKMPHEDVEARQTKKYMNAAIVACLEHIVYFLIFVSRQMHASAKAEELNMRRPLEQEFEMLVNSYVKPVWENVTVQELLDPYVASQKTAIDAVSEIVLTHNSYGSEFWWYQYFEGINHLIIVLGSVVVIFPGFFAKLFCVKGTPLKSRFLSSLVYWLYEYGMIAELIVYGPQYFWMLTNNFYVMAFNSPIEGGLSSDAGKAGFAAAFFVCLMHHTGYWVDTYSSWEVARAWGWIGPSAKKGSKTD